MIAFRFIITTKWSQMGLHVRLLSRKQVMLRLALRKDSSDCLFKLNMGNDVCELSKSDKVKESWLCFSKKEVIGVSKCSAKLSCENKRVLVDGDVVHGMGLFLNSNFLKGDRVILKSEGGSEFGNQSGGVEEGSLCRNGVGFKGSSSCAKEIILLGNDSSPRINSLKCDGPNKFQFDSGGELISCSGDASKVMLSNMDIKKMSLTYGLITIPVKWGDNDDAIKYSNMGNGRDYCLTVKGHSMKLRSSKNCLNLSWNLEKEISKVIDIGVAMGFDFNGKEVKMADIVAKAYSKLMGIKLKMENAQ
ncbi:hypothetical protein Dsin_020216 [Dipteronia sinensis]|uniref:Uncharacterized protein n=1 Tax=Dipteronia sinensis TaxID=43782 RepID=A0AAE0E3G2_9ROSI|nr:hypothetical protein Dsin_020216 [Dipteronia sinensis]